MGNTRKNGEHGKNREHVEKQGTCRKTGNTRKNREHVEKQGTRRKKTGNTRKKNREHAEKQGTRGKTGNTWKNREHAEKQGTHRKTGNTQKNREHAEKQGTCRKTGKMGIGVRVGYAEFQNRTKRVKTRPRNRNVTENNTGVLQTKVEQGETRPGPGKQAWRDKSEFRYGVA